MTLFALTEAALDISAAILWWTTKKTYYGVKYTYMYFFPEKPQQVESYEMIPLQIKNCACINHCACN